MDNDQVWSRINHVEDQTTLKNIIKEKIIRKKLVLLNI